MTLRTLLVAIDTRSLNFASELFAKLCLWRIPLFRLAQSSLLRHHVIVSYLLWGETEKVGWGGGRKRGEILYRLCPWIDHVMGYGLPSCAWFQLMPGFNIIALCGLMQWCYVVWSLWCGMVKASMEGHLKLRNHCAYIQQIYLWSCTMGKPLRGKLKRHKVVKIRLLLRKLSSYLRSRKCIARTSEL